MCVFNARRVTDAFAGCFALVLGLMLLPAAADAGYVKWTIVDGKFSDGKTCTGYFVYDPEANAFGDWALSVGGAPKDPLPAFTYKPENSAATRVNNTIVFTGPHMTADSKSNRILRIGPTSPAMTGAGGVLTLVPDSFGNGECVNCTNRRTLTGFLNGTPVTVTPAADLTITKSHEGNFVPGQTGSYTILVSNAGGSATSGTVTVVDTLPGGLTATALTGTGWSCRLQTLTCTRSDALAAGNSYPPVTLTVSIAAAAPDGVVNNTATVSGGGDANSNNNVATDPTTITGVVIPTPDLGNTGLPSNPSGSTTSPLNFTTTAGVNTATGNAYLTFKDMLVPGTGLRFNLIRSYNALDPYIGPLCRGWTHSYNILLLKGAGGAIIIKEADGHENTFQPAAGGYDAPDGVFDVLSSAGANAWRLTRPDGTFLSFGPVPLNTLLVRLLSITDIKGNAQTLSYDAAGRLVTFTDVGGRTFVFTYNASGRLISVQDVALNRVVEYSCTGTNLTRFKDAASKESLYTYDESNRLSVGSDPRANQAVNYTYDDQGRVVQARRGQTGCATAYAYDTTNRVTTITDPRSSVTRHFYDASNRLIKIVNALGLTTLFTYDGDNNVTSVTNPLGQTTTYTYDARGNRTSITDPLNHKTVFTYDAQNNLTSIKDANGVTTAYAYDARRNLTTVTDALAGVTLFTYDARGNRLTFKNANNNITNYTYRSDNRLLTTADPLGNTYLLTYDAGGRLFKVKDPNGSEKTVTFDALGRPLSVNYVSSKPSIPSVLSSFTYDPNENRLSMADSTGTTSYQYDALNRITAITFPGGRTVGYTYDCNDNRLSISYAGRTVNYTYDPLNRLATANDGTGVTTYTYDQADNLLAVKYPNGAGVSYSWDAAGRITNVGNTYIGSPGNPVNSFAYMLDNIGTRLAVVDGGGKTNTYTYDPLYRITSATVDQKTTSYTYDAVGNRKTLTAPSIFTEYTYDAADRMLTAGAVPFTYDGNGNMITRGSGTSKVTYQYDAANRLTGASGGGGPVVSYSYDGDGNRVRQQVGTASFSYLNDIATGFTTVLQETGANGTINYTRGRSLISAAGPGFTNYYLYDAQSTVVGLTGTNGHLLQRYLYDVWGTLVLSASPEDGSQNKFRYTGEQFDLGSSLYYLRARYYDPTLGRFINRDPFGGFDRQPQTLNRFVYVRNNPATLTDRTGLCSEEDDLLGLCPIYAWPGAPPLP